MVKYDGEDVKKGPWKPEEDEILINHVKKYGPRDWSSIRSKGLLMRNGKSCRLRWVNKLRPDLKNGVKFSLEEEKTVINLQAQLGNKWARIATYLTGRSDNDVKNFWSGRQKRMARIRNAPIESARIMTDVKAPAFHNPPSTEAVDINSSGFERYMTNSLSSSSLRFELLPLPELMHPVGSIYGTSDFQSNLSSIQKQPYSEQQSPNLPFPQPQSDFPCTRREGPCFVDVFENFSQPSPPICHQGVGQTPLGVYDKSYLSGVTNILATDNYFMNDFQPIEMFDEIEPFPSPSNWS